MASNRGVVVRIVIGVVLLIGLALLVNFLLRPEARVAKAHAGKAVDAVPGSVVVRAEYAMQLKSENGGRVVESAMDEGKVVKEGDFLLQLDPTDTKLELERIQTDLTAAQARLHVGSLVAPELEGAKADLVNAERQYKLGSLSEADLQKQQRVVTGLAKRVELEDVLNKQSVDTLENALKTKQRQLEKMRMTALFDGKISEIYARKGDLIGANTAIATIISTSRTVEAKISEENFSGIKVGQSAKVRFLGYGNDLYDAKVIKVLPTADPETQRYIVHLDVKIDPVLLVPGITGEVSIVVNERDSKTIVPRRALFQHYLYVVKDGVVERRLCVIGYLALNQVEIVEGIKEGDLVIVEELDRFHPGDRVRTKLVE
ncbi:MAG TPA: efflux RND transporter periplasmic adaptor subunit [Opitutaceae bacterium]|nr:efflux RND transporter periplasmic adaptor subunit [Opitutaceae bacterium]